MMFKLSQCAELNWRKLRGFNYLAKVIEGVPFKNGIEINKSDQVAAINLSMAGIIFSCRSSSP